MGSSNGINIVKAAVNGLQSLKRPEHVALIRKRELYEVAPRPMLEAVAAAKERLAATRAAKLEEVYADQAERAANPQRRDRGGYRQGGRR
jgi:hypothetical protein